jgi:hypothetical protein
MEKCACSSARKLDAERRLVDRLDEPGTRLPVNLDGGADDPIRNIFVLKHFLPSSLPAFPRRRPMVTRISDTLGAHGIVGGTRISDFHIEVADLGSTPAARSPHGSQKTASTPV